MRPTAVSPFIKTNEGGLPSLQNRPLQQCRQIFIEAENRINEVVLHQKAAVRTALSAVLAGQHCLMEGAPGTGKTLLASSLCKLLGFSWNKVTLHSDYLPSELLGGDLPAKRDDNSLDLVFRRGKIFSPVLFVDELNRAQARTQNALLEPMEEKIVSPVTLDERAPKSLSLPAPFIVIAAYNPWASKGTFPIEEALLERFGARISFTPPSKELLTDLLTYNEQNSEKRPTTELSPLALTVEGKGELGGVDLLSFIKENLAQIKMNESLGSKVASLFLALSPQHPQWETIQLPEELKSEVKDQIETGPSPRAIPPLLQLARVEALREERVFLMAQDFQDAALSVLPHRLLARSSFGEAPPNLPWLVQKVAQHILTED